MPICTFTTNLSSQQIPLDFGVDFAHQVAEMLHKPIESVTVMVHPGTQIVKGGTTEPAAVADIRSIYAFNYENAVVFVQNIRNFVNEKLGLEDNRINVIFQEIQPEQIGFNVKPH